MKTRCLGTHEGRDGVAAALWHECRAAALDWDAAESRGGPYASPRPSADEKAEAPPFRSCFS